MSKLTGYAEAAQGNAADYLYIVQGGVTKKVQIGNLQGPFTNLQSSGGALNNTSLGQTTPAPVKGTTGQFTAGLDSTDIGQNVRGKCAATQLQLGTDTDILDRYTSGIWTPTIRGSGTQGGPHTYSVQVGRWLRIGKLVFINVSLTLTALGAAMTGNAQVDGLPFASDSTVNIYQALAMASYLVDMTGTSFTQLCAIIGANASVVQFMMTGDNVSQNYLPVAGILSTTSLTFSGIYRAT